MDKVYSFEWTEFHTENIRAKNKLEAIKKFKNRKKINFNEEPVEITKWDGFFYEEDMNEYKWDKDGFCLDIIE